jgi:hypothetical protein
MAGEGHEIGSHTWSHPGLTKLAAEEVDAEFSKAYDAIKKEMGFPPLTLAYPFNQFTPEIESNALKYYVACRDYQIGVGGQRSTVEWLNAWADQQVNGRKWGVVMAHAIGSGYAAFTDPEIFRSHLHYVKSRETNIWVDTFANVSRYVKERDATKLSISSSKPGKISFVLACDSLNPQFYNVPLTIVVDAPGVLSAHAERAGQLLALQIFNGSIHIQAAPGKEPVTITW